MGLKATNVTKQFNGIDVIKNFDFTIDAGEIVTLVGKSGTGKTTLMRLLNQLEKADNGTIVIDDTFLCKENAEGKADYVSKKNKKHMAIKLGWSFKITNCFLI